MFRSALGAMMRLPLSLVGPDLRRRYRAPLCRLSAPHSITSMLMDYIPRCPCSWYVTQLHDRIIHVLEEFMLATGAIKGRDLRLEVRRIRSEASRDHLEDVVWFGLAPHLHLVIDVTVTSARTNTSVPRIGARLPLPGSLELGARHGKLDADLRTSALLGTPSVHSVHDCYLLRRMGAGWRLWWLNWSITWLVCGSSSLPWHRCC
jgi:hypothetical protein